MTARGADAPSCARTEEVLRAQGRDHALSAELVAHAADCVACSDALLVGGLLAEDAEVAFRQARVPAAAVAWWRASLAERRRDERRALRPIAVWEWLSALAATGLVALAFSGIGGSLWERLGGSLIEPLLTVAGPPELGGVWLALLAVPALALAGGLVWAATEG